MFRDAREIEDASVIECDLAVVGAGAAGIAIAHSMAGSRHQVCLVESGGLEFDPAVQDMYVGDVVGLPYDKLDIARLRFFGGATNHWAGRSRPLDEIDFETREWVPYSGWPITRAELEPFYLRAQEMCQLGPFEYRAESWLGPDEVALPLEEEALRSLVWQYSPPTRFGEAYGAELEAASNVDVLLHANLVEIAANEAGTRVEALQVATLDGRRLTVRAREFVLACGGLENARLLLIANQGDAGGLGEGREHVGRFFMEHPHLAAARALVTEPHLLGFYDYGRRAVPRHGHSIVGCLNLSPAEQRRQGVLNCDFNVTADNVGDTGFAAMRRIWKALRGGNLPDDLAADLRRVLFDIDDTVAGLLSRLNLRDYQAETGSFLLWSSAEQAPNPDSRVVLSEQRDALGLPRIALDWRLLELDERSLRVAHQVVAEQLGQAGLGRVQIQDWLSAAADGWAPELIGGHHHMGTTRMADEPTRGVVDRHCRMHGVANLHIAGSSVFPTSGSANPTLTIVALALRLAETLEAKLA